MKIFNVTFYLGKCLSIQATVTAANQQEARRTAIARVRERLHLEEIVLEPVVRERA